MWIEITTMISLEVETAGSVGKRGALAAPCCCVVKPLSFTNNSKFIQYSKNDCSKKLFHMTQKKSRHSQSIVLFLTLTFKTFNIVVAVSGLYKAG